MANCAEESAQPCKSASCNDIFPNGLKARFPVFNGFGEVDGEERGRGAGDGGVGRTIELRVNGEGRPVATRDPEGTGSGAVRELRDDKDEGRGRRRPDTGMSVSRRERTGSPRKGPLKTRARHTSTTRTRRSNAVLGRIANPTLVEKSFRGAAPGIRMTA